MNLNCLFPVTCSLLPTPYSLLPAPCSLSVITNSNQNQSNPN
ncbi:hypothetical protein [Moorena producens]|nr:hypothetical protein [Moorena producens]